MNYDAVLIAGPTGSGKSAAALAIAEAFGGTIINADSMQVYRELRILTSRPSSNDEERAPHLLYGIASAHERYSAGRYQNDAAEALDQTRRAGRLSIFAGGTGLYFDVLMHGLSPMPQVPAEVRAEVRRRFEVLGRDAFFADLRSRDPSAGKLRPSDTQRMLRAADILEATGQPLSHWQERVENPVLAGLKLALFVLAPLRDLLDDRISARVDAMFATGAIEEARALAGIDLALPAAKALGVPQIWRYLAGEIDLNTAAARTKLATGQYAKRQMTWFRQRMKDWSWLRSHELSNNIAQLKEYIT